MNTAPENSKAKRLLAWLLIALQVAPLPAYAATPLSVDATVVGAKPILNVSANGVPIVQIVPPNTAGVSHNRFTLYNVGVEGQVLNNSGLGSASVLAGSVAGNPMLGNTNARLILNEVTSPNYTQLNGRIEIAGKRADLVIANPNGIIVDGAGFINTARATLTTGTSQLTNGVVADTLSVQRSPIYITGKGLDARGADQLLLISRYLGVYGNLYANGLNVVTGANQINGSAGTLTPIAATPGVGVFSRLAVDVSNLGNMYANSIYLVGTEAGLGVNSRGKMQALTGDIQLSSAGDITVTNGQLKAAWDVRANAKRDMTLQATDVQAGGDIELVTGRHLNVTATRADASASTVVGISGGTNTTSNASTQYTGSVLQAGGDIALVANTVANPAATLNAAGYAAQRAQLEANVTTLQTQVAALKLSGPVASYDAAVIQLNAAQVTLQNLITTYSGGKITLSGSGVRSEGNILMSGADVSVNSVNDSKLVRNVVYTSSTGCSWLGLHCTTTTSTTATQDLKETLKGGEVSALGDVNILPLGNRDAAGALLTESGNLLLLGAKVNSNFGQVQLTAANDLEVESSQSRSSQLSQTQTNSSSGWFVGGSYSSDINLALDAEAIKKAEGTTVSGNSVQLRSGRDVMVRGSVLSADKDIQIVAGRDVDVVEARDLTNREMVRESKKSGLHSEGLFGISIGNSTTTQTSGTTIDNASSSQIGSIAGGVSIMGGRNVLVQGSDVVAGTDIDVIGNNVSIAAAKNIFTREDSYKVRSSGITLALKGGVISSLESAWQAAQKSKRATDTRLKKAYDFKAGYDLYRATQQAPELATLGKGFSELLSGNTAAASKTLGIQLELSLGASSSTTTTTQKQTDWRAANLFSNGDTTLIARSPTVGQVGVGKLDVMGSNLDANNLTLSAGNTLTARNSQQTTVSKETSSNTSANVGVGFGQDGLYFTAS
ncbi:MAG: filamentous hemagglutinin N-terminal domain-containing protein, partial [Gallionella sp.]|nr:filamentous hemagglutinin N-terminal domain-containing protein [Gallionella sp.]